MKLIIDIAKTEYDNILKVDSNDYWEKIIKNGTPLPKGHGRLIDADVLADGFEDNYEFCEEVNATPTVIEADKENKQ